MEDKQKLILRLLKDYEEIVKIAEDEKLISTKNFVGDIIETLVCNQIKAEKCTNNAQKGYDATRNGEKDLIQIKYRSKNKSGKYKITFKNISEAEIGFNVLALCCKTSEGYFVYEIKLEDFPKSKFNHDKQRRILLLEEGFLESDKTIKHHIKFSNQS